MHPKDRDTGAIVGLDHVQIAMPPGQEDVARAFYRDVLGLTEEPKPANLAPRGGVWFRGGTLRLHLGVESEFRPARKAHPALLVQGLAAVESRCDKAGFTPARDEPLESFDPCYATIRLATGLSCSSPADSAGAAG